MSKINHLKNVILFGICIFLTSCFATKPYEDAMLVGKGNRAVELTLDRALFVDNDLTGNVSLFVNRQDIGYIGINYIYGLSENIDINAGWDFPTGMHARLKYGLKNKGIHSAQAFSVELRSPLRLVGGGFNDGTIYFSMIPTYIYTYRHDNILNASVNLFVNSSYTESGYLILPGLAAGFGIGDELRFSAGLKYSRTVFSSDGSQFQFLTVESSIKYDF